MSHRPMQGRNPAEQDEELDREGETEVTLGGLANGQRRFAECNRCAELISTVIPRVTYSVA